MIDLPGISERALHPSHQTGQTLFGAELAAREMRGLSLYDALDLCQLIAKAKPGKYERAAIRWHGRLELEAGTLQLHESITALAVLDGLPSDPRARECPTPEAAAASASDACGAAVDIGRAI